MNENIEFLNNDFDEANAYLNDHSIDPDENSLGFFDSFDGAGQFYWFNNEADLKLALLNGWYARNTEEREADYYDGLALLRVYLEISFNIDTLCQQIPENLCTDNQIIWSGHLLNLVTDQDDFATSFREEFRDFIEQKKIKLTDPEIIGSLLQFLKNYCKG